MSTNAPLAGLKVVDFSTLLPGPFTSLLLAEAGAEVIKVERPGRGDEMRTYEPRFGEDSAIFALLNRGKKSLALDLKDPADNAVARRLAANADIVIEQFRPRVMKRLGLDYEALARENPGLIYCSITGYGQHSPKAQRAAHDLNWLAESGALSLVSDQEGIPALVPSPLSDIGAGTYPAFMNILLGLYQRMATGRGTYIDVAMMDNTFPFIYWALAWAHTGKSPAPNEALITGASPRWSIYATADGRYLAVAALEDQFWQNFCTALELPTDASRDMVARRVGTLTSSALAEHVVAGDCCCSIVATVEEALTDPHCQARNLFANRVVGPAGSIPALPTPVAEPFRVKQMSATFPTLNDQSKCL